MLQALQIATLMLVSIAMACSLAHALEFPGKLRLSKEIYAAVQPIYYPGFTVIGGFAEILGLLGTFALLFAAARDSTAFRLTAIAFIALLCMHAVFWAVTQPVNKYWLREQNLSAPSSMFFGIRKSSPGAAPQDWTVLRDRWEYSHVARAVLSFVAMIMLACAIAVT